MDALQAVPNNSALVIEIKSPHQLFPKLQDKPYLEDVNALSIINNVSSQWKTINNILKKAQKLSFYLLYIFCLNLPLWANFCDSSNTINAKCPLILYKYPNAYAGHFGS